MSVVDKPSTSISLSVSNSPPLAALHPALPVSPPPPSIFVLLPGRGSLFPPPSLSTTTTILRRVSFSISLSCPSAFAPLPLAPSLRLLWRYRLPAQLPTPINPSVTSTTPPPLIHSHRHPSPPQPLGPACCLVACTVSHRCSSLQRWYSSRQLRSNVQLTSAYDLAGRG